MQLLDGVLVALAVLAAAAIALSVTILAAGLAYQARPGAPHGGNWGVTRHRTVEPDVTCRRSRSPIPTTPVEPSYRADRRHCSAAAENPLR